MNDVEAFGLVVLITSVAGMLAVLSNRLSERIRIPAPAMFLFCAAVASELRPSLYDLKTHTVQRIVTLALAVILFDGGMHIGWRRFRSSAVSVGVVGVVGTFLTAGGVAVLAHALFGIGWRSSLLLGAAIAPTDPAVVFSVLGRREIGGRAGTILEGESGANDPVGIALLLSILAASGAGAGAIGHGIAEFVLQMVVGLAVGLVGGVALLEFMRRVPLPNAALYPLRTLACGMALYGLAAVAHGSGFLAVFTAGILIGDARAPYKMEIERFHSAVASFGEIVAFVVLGFTVHLDSLTKHNTWAIGLALAALLTFVVRPVLVGALLLPIRLRRGEKAFILWAGLKGAVPILLGTFIIAENVSDRTRLYGLIFIVVAFSVVVQGSMVPTVAHAMGVPMRTVEPEPWTAGVRLRDEPENLHRYVVAAESVADGTTIADLPGEDDIWISLVTRDGRLVPIRGSTELRAGDEVLAIVSPERADEQARLFRRQ